MFNDRYNLNEQKKPTPPRSTIPTSRSSTAASRAASTTATSLTRIPCGL